MSAVSLPSVSPVKRSRDSSPWAIAAAAAIGSLLVIVFAYSETIASIISVWQRSDSYSHGFLIIPVSLYLIWLERGRLARIAPKTKIWGLVALAGFSISWLTAHLVNVEIVKQLSLLLLVAATIWTVLGPSVSRVMAFPIGYLLLAIPIWSFLIPVLQDNTAISVARMLETLGVPVFLEGYYLSIPSGRFVVAEVCAGLRFLLATLALSALYAYLNYRTFWRGALFVVAGIILAVVSNWIRAMVIVLAGHLTEMQHPLVEHHIWLGWLIFGLALVPLLLFGAWLREPPVVRQDFTGAVAKKSGPSAKGTKQVLIASLAAVLVSALGPVAVYFLENGVDGRYAVSLAPVAPAGAWSDVVAHSMDWRPQFPGADAEILRSYRKAERRVALYVAYYHRQDQGAELVNELNSIFDPKRWTLARRREAVLSHTAGGGLEVEEFDLRSRDGNARLLWQWYVVAGRSTSSRNLAKLFQLVGLITRRPGAAVVSVAIDHENRPEQARDVLEDFTRHMAPKVFSNLRELATDATRAADGSH